MRHLHFNPRVGLSSSGHLLAPIGRGLLFCISWRSDLLIIIYIHYYTYSLLYIFGLQTTSYYFVQLLCNLHFLCEKQSLLFSNKFRNIRSVLGYDFRAYSNKVYRMILYSSVRVLYTFVYKWFTSCLLNCSFLNKKWFKYENFVFSTDGPTCLLASFGVFLLFK